MSLKINDNIDLPNSITAHNRIALKSVSVGGGGASPELIARVAKLERTVTKQQGAIEEMDRDLEGVHDTLESVGTDITELDTAMTAAEGEISAIHSKDAAQDATIATKQDQLTFDSTPTEDSANPVTSDGIFKSLADVIEIAEGKTDSFTLSAQTVGNESFNSQAGFIEVESFTDINGNEVAANELKIGDIILVTELDVPDRWVGTVGETVTLYRMETQKVDLTDYYTKAQSDARFFRVIDPPASTTLTDDEIEIFKQGCIVKGVFLGVRNPVFFPPATWVIGASDSWHGLCEFRPGAEGTWVVIATYSIVNKKITLQNDASIMFNATMHHLEFTGRVVNISGTTSTNIGGGQVTIKGKQFPSYPTTNANPANLQIAPNGGAMSWKEVINNLAPEYDATATYAVGDVCLHDGALYQCFTAIATAEAWDSTHWTQVKVDDVYANLGKIANGNVPQDAVLGIDANNNIVKGNLFGKYARVVTPSQIQAMSAEERKAVFKEGCIINGSAFGCTNPIIMPMAEFYGGSRLRGLAIAGHGIYGIQTNANTFLPDSVKHEVLYYEHWSGTTTFRLIGINFALPAIPDNDTYSIIWKNKTPQWQEQLYGPSVSDNAITELTYEKISVISVAADRTFTLKTAQTDCIPEYRATITNIGSANVILTFTGITAIKTNDPDITITGNNLVLPPSTTIEVSAYNGHLIAFNWSV